MAAPFTFYRWLSRICIRSHHTSQFANRSAPGTVRGVRKVPPAPAPLLLDDDTVVDRAPQLVDLMRQGPCTRAQVARWVTNGVDVAASDVQGTSPLMLAASRGSLDIVVYLVGRGVAVNTMDRRGYTAFALAATGGRNEVAGYLKSRGANPNAVAPLFDMARAGRLQALRTLAHHGTQLHLRDRAGNTVLICAAAAGHLSVVAFLLQQGLDVELRNNRGVDAVQAALAGGHFRLATLLETGHDTYSAASLRYVRYRLRQWQLSPYRTSGR